MDLRQKSDFTYSMLPVIIKHQGFSHSLSLIIATPDPCVIYIGKHIIFQEKVMFPT